jgi:hypothetical protein
MTCSCRAFRESGCGSCEGELERAPLSDKVISGRIYGSALVSTLLVRKYDHSVTLHRHREELWVWTFRAPRIRSEPLGYGLAQPFSPLKSSIIRSVKGS